MQIFRKTVLEDVAQVMKIIDKGKEYLKISGVDQWQRGYPNESAILHDIENGHGYVLEIGGKIVGTTALSFDGEPCYDVIKEGKWLTEDKFLVIHRMAVANECRGSETASSMLKKIEEICEKQGVNSIKIDTHADNIAMQRLVAKNNFTYCGLVMLPDGERLAYEKIIRE